MSAHYELLQRIVDDAHNEQSCSVCAYCACVPVGHLDAARELLAAGDPVPRVHLALRQSATPEERAAILRAAGFDA